MFYRMTRLHFEEDEFEALMHLAESLRGRIEGIVGLEFADLAKTGEGEGMMITAYRDEADYVTAAGEVAEILGALTEVLTSTPHGHEGTVVLSFGDSPAVNG